MIPGNERLIIVCGMAHSGTTILTHILRQHPNIKLITNGNESWLLENDWLPNEDSQAIANCLAENPNKRILLKRPWNVLHHGDWMAKEMPDAKFIYCDRPFSQIRKSWSKLTSLVDAKLRFDSNLQSEVYSKSVESLIGFSSRVNNIQIFPLTALMENPQEKVNRLTEWIGLSSFEFETSAVNGPLKIRTLLHPHTVSGKYQIKNRGNGFNWGITDEIVRSDIDLSDHEDWIYPHLQCPEEGVFVDVGAFVGTHAVRIAQSCNCKVIAFEPIQKHVDLLKFNAEINEVRVDVITRAVGDFCGLVGFRDDGPGGSGVPFNPDNITCTVPITTLDQALEKLDRIDVLLIDVEGWEVRALRGGVEVINRTRPKIIVEVHSHYKRCSHNGNHVEEWAKQNNYSVRRIWENTPSYFYVEMLPC